MKRLYRSKKQALFGGVLAGLANYLQIDQSLIRLSFLCLLIFTGFFPLLIAYFIAYLILPLEPLGYHPAAHKKLYRSRTDKKVAGICGGMGRYFRLDSTIIRVVVVILTLITGVFPLILIYIIGSFIIPETPDEQNIEIVIEEKDH